MKYLIVLFSLFLSANAKSLPQLTEDVKITKGTEIIINKVDNNSMFIIESTKFPGEDESWVYPKDLAAAIKFTNPQEKAKLEKLSKEMVGKKFTLNKDLKNFVPDQTKQEAKDESVMPSDGEESPESLEN